MKKPLGRSGVAVGASVIAVAASGGLFLSRSQTAAIAGPECVGTYSDAFQLRSLRVRAIEQGPRSQYSYLVRTSVVYECPFFSPDGKLRRRHVDALEHGTAFAYERSGNDTFLLTTEHTAEWPDVTDSNHRVDGVPEGCKRLSDKLRIVTDEKDDYEPGQIPLVRVAVDPVLDAAVLKASQPLNVIPYRVGRSAALRQGNAVQVRGFPLGLIEAVNVGKVVNPYDHDEEQGWDHVDFVIDALLSEGNSGSPVLAISCASGALELVGMFHAGYKGHSALNVVIGIDQLREFMKKKRRVPRTTGGGDDLGAVSCQQLLEGLKAEPLPLMDFGGLFVRVEGSDGHVLYHVYGRRFPLDGRRLAVLEDHGADALATPADPKRAWFRNDLGWKAWALGGLGADERDLVQRSVKALRLQALRTFEYRKSLLPRSSAEERRHGRDFTRDIARAEPASRDLAAALVDLADRLGPTQDGAGAAAGLAAEHPLPKAGLPAAK